MMTLRKQAGTLVSAQLLAFILHHCLVLWKQNEPRILTELPEVCCLLQSNKSHSAPA